MRMSCTRAGSAQLNPLREHRIASLGRESR